MASPWVKLAADFYFHPKVLEVGNAGAGLFARCLAYCGARETDGEVPASVVAHLLEAGEEELPQALVDVGLWRREGTLYTIPDFLEWNLSAEAWGELRSARSAAGAAGARARWNGKSHGKSHGKPNGKTMAGVGVGEEDGAKAPSSAAVLAVYGYWRAKLGPKGARHNPSKRLAGHIRARLREGLDVTTLRRAIDGLAGSDWHRRNGRIGLELVVRDSDRVAMFLARGGEGDEKDGLWREWVAANLPDLPPEVVPNAVAIASTLAARAERGGGEGPTAEAVLSKLGLDTSGGVG